MNQENKNIVKITKDMNLGEVVFKYPEAAEVLTDYGLSCVGCFASSFDSIEQGAKIHQLSDEELDEMLERINEVIEHGE
jgi:hybrid cluster-associated redox disulfide protein